VDSLVKSPGLCRHKCVIWFPGFDDRSFMLPAVSAHYGNPDQFRIVGDALAGGEIPILLVPETRDVAVHKNKLRALVVQIAVDLFCWATAASPPLSNNQTTWLGCRTLAIFIE